MKAKNKQTQINQIHSNWKIFYAILAVLVLIALAVFAITLTGVYGTGDSELLVVALSLAIPTLGLAGLLGLGSLPFFMQKNRSNRNANSIAAVVAVIAIWSLLVAGWLLLPR